jgi:hypothetical protein
MTTRLFALLLAFSASASALTLVNPTDTFRYRKGTSAPQAGWQALPDASLDASWLAASPGFFGYGDSTPGTVLSDMRQTTTPANAGYRSFYVRRSFTIPAGEPATDRLKLRTDFDDGFVVWIVDASGTTVVADYGNAPGITTAAPAPPNVEPAFNAGPSSTHESSIGGNGAQAAQITDLGPLSNFPAGTYTLCGMCMNESLNSSDAVLHLTLTTEAPSGSGCTPVSGAITAGTTWIKANSPYCVTSAVTIPAGVTLTIEPGVIVRFATGVGMSIQGRLVAESTEAERILFTREATTGTWGRLNIDQTGGTRQVQRLVYVDIDYASSGSSTVRGTQTELYLEHVRFTNTNAQMVDMVGTSGTLLYCDFNTISSGELIHFSNMPSAAQGGKALIQGCLFGTSNGYNDIVDFTGGNRPGPIVRFRDNVFIAGVDDCFDMDGTDAHIEGNVFLNIRKDAARSSSSNCITTGGNGSDITELVMCRNLFFNVEHCFMEKEGGTGIFQNNTFARVTANPVSNNVGEASGIVAFGEPWRGVTYGGGVIFEGNVGDELLIADPFPLYAAAQAATGAFLVRRQNCLNGFTLAGTGNVNANPQFVDLTGVTVQNIRAKLALQSSSPCRGTGPNGLDMGAVVPGGATITGEPPSTTTQRNATLNVAGPGIWAYRWRLNGGPWSSDINLVPAAQWNGSPFTATMLDNPTPIILTDLADGTYTVEVQGKDSAGFFHEAPTASKSWTVANIIDTDLDGLPDTWETTYGLDPNLASDAMLDSDGDEMTNLQEFAAGTQPNDASSRLAATVALTSPSQATVSFPGVIGKSYRLEASDDLLTGSWQMVHSVPALVATATVALEDALPPTVRRRFYRVITPAN